MLLTQEYLRKHGTLDQLVKELSLRTTQHPCHPLVILNYDQIDSPKRNPIVQECRGLVLEQGSWDVVARSFTRFFNAGEAPDLEKKFDWNNFVAESKEDGSLILLYRYKGQWLVNTRGSFAQGEIVQGVGKTWEEVFRSALLPETFVRLDHLFGGHTLVFELCSPYNKVVRNYSEPTAFLLTGFFNKSGMEFHEVDLDNIAKEIGARRPARYEVGCLEQAINFLETQDDPTFEGFVLRDRNGLRMKVKNSRYVALHHLKDNGNIFATKNLLPLVHKGEVSEVLLHFPEAAPKAFDVAEKLGGAWGRLEAVWDVAKTIEKQKDFALFVTKHTSLACILFEARKQGRSPREVWKESQDVLVKKLAA